MNTFKAKQLPMKSKTLIFLLTSLLLFSCQEKQSVKKENNKTPQFQNQGQELVSKMLEKVGVQFVPDVKPYEKMKLRLLNAGHSVLGLLGAIHGHPTINACMEDDLFVSYLRAFMDKEATPVLDKLEGIDLSAYKDSLQERFANPNIKDSVSRICSESSAKLPKFLIATIQDNLANGGSIKFATLVIAAWCYYSDKAQDKNDNPIEIIDAMQEQLHQAASKTQSDPLAFIKQESLFGNLINEDKFTSLY